MFRKSEYLGGLDINSRQESYIAVFESIFQNRVTIYYFSAKKKDKTIIFIIYIPYQISYRRPKMRWKKFAGFLGAGFFTVFFVVGFL